MIATSRISSMVLRKIHQPISSKINTNMRFQSGKPTIEPMSYLQQTFLKEHKYVLPLLHVANSKPTRTCGEICEIFNYWLDIPQDKLNEIWHITDSAHNVLILLDDLLDNSILRRKLPSANTIFGYETTLAVTNLIQYFIVEAGIRLGHPDAVKILVRYLRNASKGLAMEVLWYHHKYIPSEEEYDESLLRKVGSAVWGQTSLMKLFSKHKYDFDPLWKSFGKYHQILDDYNDLGLQNIKNNIVADDDITVGAYTFPMVHALRTNPDDYQIHRILELRTRDINIKKHFVSLLEKYGSLEHTRNTINKLELEVRDEIEKLGGNPLFTKLMDKVKSTNISTTESFI